MTFYIVVQANPKTVIIKKEGDQKIPTAAGSLSAPSSLSPPSRLSATTSSNAVTLSNTMSGATIAKLAGHAVPKPGLAPPKSIALLSKHVSQPSTVRPVGYVTSSSGAQSGTHHLSSQSSIKGPLPSVRSLASATGGQKPLLHSSVVKSTSVKTVGQTPAAKKTVGQTPAAKKTVGQTSAANIILGRKTPQSIHSVLQTSTSSGQHVVNLSPEFINSLLGTLQSDGNKHILQVLSNKESIAQPAMQRASTAQLHPVNMMSPSASAAGKTIFVQSKQEATHQNSSILKSSASLSPSEVNRSLSILQRDQPLVTTPSSPSLLGAMPSSSQVQQVAHILPTTLSSGPPLSTRSPSSKAQSPKLQHMNVFPSIAKPTNSAAAILAAHQQRMLAASRSPPKLVTPRLPTTSLISPSSGLSSSRAVMSGIISPMATFSARPSSTGAHKPSMTTAASMTIPLTHNPYLQPLSSVAYAPPLPAVSTTMASSASQLPSQDNAKVFTVNLQGSLHKK